MSPESEIAIAELPGKILYLGSGEDLLLLITPKTGEINLEGHTSAPNIVRSKQYFHAIDSLLSLEKGLKRIIIEALDEIYSYSQGIKKPVSHPLSDLISANKKVYLAGSYAQLPQQVSTALCLTGQIMIIEDASFLSELCRDKHIRFRDLVEKLNPELFGESYPKQLVGSILAVAPKRPNYTWTEDVLRQYSK